MLMTPPSAARTTPHAKRLLDSHITSEALSARVIAGGEGGDPRLRGEGEVGCDVCERKHPAPRKHHLTLPLLRNGPHPLPRCAAERDSEMGRHDVIPPAPQKYGRPRPYPIRRHPS